MPDLDRFAPISDRATEPPPPPPPPPPPAARCPACGYDLRGGPAGWTTACPLRGACPECGRSFAWREAIETGRCRWLFETRQGRRRLLALPATMLRACVPPRFWRDLPRDLPMPERSVVLLPIDLLLLAGLAVVAAHVVAAHDLAVVLRLDPGRAALGASGHAFTDGLRIARYDLPLLVAMLGPGLAAAIASRNRRADAAALVRVAIYAALPVCLLLAVALWGVLLLVVARIADTGGVLSELAGRVAFVDVFVEATRATAWRNEALTGNPFRPVGETARALDRRALAVVLAAAAWMHLSWWFGIRRHLRWDRNRAAATLLLALVLVGVGIAAAFARG